MVFMSSWVLWNHSVELESRSLDEEAGLPARGMEAHAFSTASALLAAATPIFT
jgi:hypothetical protein